MKESAVCDKLRMRIIVSLLLLLFFFLPGTSAPDSRPYGGKEEMSCTLINDICRDSLGFIWIATEYGLNKFDGISIRSYLHDEQDSFSIAGNNIHKLMIDKSQRLWLCFINGLQYYDAGADVFRNIRFPDNIQPHVTAIRELHSGVFWIGTSGKGLYELNVETNEIRLLDAYNHFLENKVISCIYEDKGGTVWTGSINNGLLGDGLLQINPASRTASVCETPGILNNNINAIVEDRQGRLYIGTSNFVLRYDTVRRQFIPVPYEDKISVRCMIPGNDGRIFVGTEGQGLKYIDESGERLSSLENHPMAFNFNRSKIHALMEDRDGNLWLGCFQKGVFMIPNQPTQFDFWNFSGRSPQSEGIVTAICRDFQGSIWCGVNNEGIFRFNNKGEVEKHFPQLYSAVNLFEDSNHTLWVSSYEKAHLAQVDKNSGQCRYLAVPQSGYIKTMIEDRRKRLYLSTFGSGFIRYDLTAGKWEPIDIQGRNKHKWTISNPWINTLLCDSKGLIWLGHYQGVSCYDPERNCLTGESYLDSLAQQICLSLIEDRNGNIWAGTYKGLFCIHPQTKNIRNYTTGDGLSNNVICGLAEDEEGNIWCSTFQGINQIKVKENRIINYYTGNGLVDKIYNRGVYFQDKEGVVYFGGQTGITSFSPRNIRHTPYDREIRLTRIYLQNQPVNSHTLSGGKPVLSGSLSTAGEFHFSYEDNTFTFEFSTMDFSNPENVYYEYRLKELSSHWSITQPGINRVTYNHLPPGNYTMEVRACKYGSYSPLKQWTLTVSPPWYKSKPAYIVYFLLFLNMCALAIYLVNRKRKELINEAKLRFFIDISHEIRSPMTLIISPLEKLMKESHDESTLRVLERIHRNARRILGLINQLLDMRKIDKGQMCLQCHETDLVGFIEELFDVFGEQASRRNIRFTFERPAGRLPVWIDRNNFDKVLMNILSNAFKYTPDRGEINIRLTSGLDETVWGPLRHFAEIRIIDTGTGIDEDKIKKIFTRFYQAQNELTFGTMGSGIGLNLSRTLIDLHQGAIRASNRKDVQGSCFTIRIPLGKEHIKKENRASGESHSRLLLQQESYIQPSCPKTKLIRSKTNYKILVVDDEEEMRDFLRQELKETYKVLTARNGSEGLQMTLSQMPDLVISDIMMPEMDGFALVKKLKSNANICHIPIILLSSKAEREDRLDGLDKGADAYLSKPFHTDELKVMVGNLINIRQVLKGKFSGAQDQQDKLKPVELKSSDEILMERIMTVINDNLDNLALNVSMLASNVGLSRTQLHRKFKELTGIPAGDFIRNIRLKQAAKLLKEKQMNVSQIAYTVGFTNQAHFSATFKKFYGVSPMEYIAQGKNN